MFMLDSSLSEEENKEIIRSKCLGLYRNMFDLLTAVCESTPLIKDSFEFSVVYFSSYIQPDEPVSDKVIQEWSLNEWMQNAADWWT